MTARLVLGLALGAMATVAPRAAAQERLLGGRRAELGAVHEQWRFPSALPQPVGADTVRVRSATQLSLPITAMVPITERWTFDLYGAYARGRVELDSADPAGNTAYELAGLTDVRLRLTGRLRGDGVMLTLGARLPTGRTALPRRELEALRVLAAPALRFQTPSLGAGFGATMGLVLARPVGGWAWALGTSYEVRGSYAPFDAAIVGADPDELDPGDVLHLSLGTDGLVGPHRMAVALSGDFHSRDEIVRGGASTEYRLGPSLTAEWQMQLAAARFRELTAYATARHRARFTLPSGRKAEHSSGVEVDGGMLGTMPWTPSLALVVGLDGRYHTGLKVDNSVATAAIATGGGTLGLAWGGGAATLTPYLRAQAGSIDTGGFGTSAVGLSGGITLGTRF